MPREDRPDRPDRPQSAETRRDWEVLQENVGQDKTERLRIGSGWLFRTTVQDKNTGAAAAVGLVYVPSAAGE